MPGDRTVRRVRAGFSRGALQGESLDELHRNLPEVIEMLLEDGEPRLDAEFASIQQAMVP